MRRPVDLPPSLAQLPAFSVATAKRHGVSERRLRSRTLVAPFHGVRMPGTAAPLDARAAAAAYASRMPSAQFFSHATAALLWGAPLPRRIETSRTLHVAVLKDRAQPRARGVIGHRLDPAQVRVVEQHGLRLADPASTWCRLPGLLGFDDLVAVGDFLVTGAEPSGGPPAVSSLAELERAVDAGRWMNAGLLREALGLVRVGPLSRPESINRLRFVRAGLPEPVPNLVVRDDAGRAVAMVDHAYPGYRVGVEYEGEDHLERARFRRDLHRAERLADAGWLIVRLSGDDLPVRPPNVETARMRETVERIAARLRSRGWVGAVGSSCRVPR